MIVSRRSITRLLWFRTDIDYCLWSLFQRDTRPSTQDVLSYDPGSAGPVPVPLHSAGKVFVRATTIILLHEKLLQFDWVVV